MTTEWWHDKWASGQIGFHEPTVNPLLTRHWPTLGAGRRVLVPLCGKSLDLAWLVEQGHEVVGVELVEKAVRDYFTESGLEPEVTADGVVKRYRHGRLTLCVADVFDLPAAEIGTFDALYDRGALVALPAGVRPRYARHIRSLLAPKAVGLVVTFEYDQQRMSGPPYSVADDEVALLCGPGGRVTPLGVNTDALADNPKFAERGLDVMTEKVLAITISED